MLTSLSLLIGLCAGIFVLLCLYVYARQERFLFFPGPNDPAILQQFAAKGVEIASGDILLQGWWADNADAATSAVILYFGGNAEDVLYTATTARRFEARRMLFVNYRGYGATPGTPGQDALFRDALAIYDYAVGAGGVRPEDVVVMGRSLGTGVATMLAANRPIRSAVLVTPYDSIVAVAARHFSMLPVGLLLKHRFPAVDLAPRTKAAGIMIAAEQDNVIPPIHAQRLFDAWPGEKHIHILEGAGHNDIEQHPQYYPLINAFLMKHRTADRTP